MEFKKKIRKLNIKPLRKKFHKFLRKINPKPLKSTFNFKRFCYLVKVSIEIFLILAAIIGVYAFFADELFQKEITTYLKVVLLNQELQLVQFGVLEEKIESKLEDQINCSDLENDWVIAPEMSIKGQYFILGKNEVSGVATFEKSFYNLFELNLAFTPFSLEGANTVVSFKDKEQNEIIITVGDGDYETLSLVLKKEGEFFERRKKILPGGIKRNEKIKLRVESILRSDSILISGILYYTPKDKVGKILKENITIELPYKFESGNFSLYLGLRNEERSEHEIKTKLTDCFLWEKRRPLY